MLINEHTWQYVFQHQDDDIRTLALRGSRDAEVNMSQALQQIAGRQTARRKLPSWAAVERLVYPPHLNMEQCSSEQTARYKARLVGEGDSMVDLTGGFGIDFYWMSQGFRHRTYVERDAQLCAISSENFRLLNHTCEVLCQDGADYLSAMSPVSLIYLDPARRNQQGGRTYSIADCTPNVLELLPMLQQKADNILLKLSPMLDWRKAVSDLGNVREVHIVSVDNECKELLLLLGKQPAPVLRMCCANNDQLFEYTVRQQPAFVEPAESTPLDDLSPDSSFLFEPHASIMEAGSFLFEPHASIMKAGCFDTLQQRFPVCQAAQHSHLFLSAHDITDFPGRRFQIQRVTSMNKHDLRLALADVHRANISVRNFPMSADLLRKKLRLQDGGDVYIFATTLQEGKHRLFICRKIS